ncbi:MAG: RNA-binding protein [Candidatus Melainabacteria bacterium HGW-Melainabacteria-1]|nr:MAG: RNA-binding protein [Candidatus Melainabacteria bacterium HGW-Melainabacteria-1]
MKIFVGNLSPEASEDDLRQAAEAFGSVTEVSITLDEQGVSKGFGFVVMANKDESQAALAGLNGQDLKGQAIRTSEARPEKRRGAGGSSRGGFGAQGPQASRGPGTSHAGGSKGGFDIGKSGGRKV